MACGILVPWQGIKPMPPALEAQNLNHQTVWEVPFFFFSVSFASFSSFYISLNLGYLSLRTSSLCCLYLFPKWSSADYCETFSDWTCPWKFSLVVRYLLDIFFRISIKHLMFTMIKAEFCLSSFPSSQLISHEGFHTSVYGTLVYLLAWTPKPKSLVPLLWFFLHHSSKFSWC